MTSPGDLIINVTTTDGVGHILNENSNVKITVEGTNPEIVQYTDANGSCTIKNLTVGTYTIILSKDGYGTFPLQDYTFIGSKNPVTLSEYLYKKCATKILNYSLSLSSHYLLFSGNLTSNYTQEDVSFYPYGWPSLTIYLSDSSNVSTNAYKTYLNFYSDKNNSSSFHDSIYLYPSIFPSGKTVYTVLCGENQTYIMLFDLTTNRYYDSSLGDLSEVKNIVVP